jgi:hypothetical protein
MKRNYHVFALAEIFQPAAVTHIPPPHFSSLFIFPANWAREGSCKKCERISFKVHDNGGQFSSRVSALFSPPPPGCVWMLLLPRSCPRYFLFAFHHAICIVNGDAVRAVAKAANLFCIE